MSIKRIESAYAYFMDKQLSGPQMSVLQALAYCANENQHELCYPSDNYVAQMTHLSERSVVRARLFLRERKIIDWTEQYVDGTRLSNDYLFTFPLMKMPKKERKPTRYESICANPPTVTVSPPHCHSVSTPLTQCQSNSERNKEINSEISPATLSEGIKTVCNNFKVDYSLHTRPEEFVCPRDKMIPVSEAMRVCGLSRCDNDNMRTFAKVMASRSGIECLEIINQFDSEIKAGEHANAHNLAAILTKRLMRASKG